MNTRIITTLLTLLLCTPLLAQEDRGFVADRPGATDSPQTMLPGHYRIESSLLSLSQDKTGNTQLTETSYLGFNLITGISEHSEIQLSFVPLIQQSIKSGASEETETQSGDVGFKLKRNLVGNNGGPVAVALTPQLQITSAQNGGNLGGGLGIPISLSLPLELSLAITPQWNLNYDEDDNTFTSQYMGFVLGRDFSDSLNLFVEYFSTASVENGFESNAGFGLAHQVCPRFQWDVSADFGLTESATDTIISAGVIYAWN